MPRTLMPTPDDAEPERRPSIASVHLDLVSYLPLASACYAIVQYSPATARTVVDGGRSLHQELSVRRIIGLFADIPSARHYAMQNNYQSYDVVPATAVIATSASRQ